MNAAAQFTLSVCRSQVTATGKADAIRKFNKTGRRQTYLRPGYLSVLEKNNRTWSILRYYPVDPRRSVAAFKAWVTMRSK